MIREIKLYLAYAPVPELHALMRALGLHPVKTTTRETARDTVMTLIDAGRLKRRQVCDAMPANVEYWLIRNALKQYRVSDTTIASWLEYHPNTISNWAKHDAPPLREHTLKALRDKAKSKHYPLPHDLLVRDTRQFRDAR